MKIALLGKGKTGGKVIELHPKVEVFDRANPPTFEKLMGCDVVISFLPGDAFLSFIPLLIETKLPVVTGSTGLSWPGNFHQTLRDKKIKWIHATNFFLGVVIMKQLVERLHQVSGVLEHKMYTIHEVHHTKKLDAPSGTALSMAEWLKEPCDITSERTGDVVGFHELTLQTGAETIKLSHEAKDRSLFAEGALWAARMITNDNIEYGFHPFQKIVEQNLSI